MQKTQIRPLRRADPRTVWHNWARVPCAREVDLIRSSAGGLESVGPMAAVCDPATSRLGSLAFPQCCLSFAGLAARAEGFSVAPGGLSLRRRCGPGLGGAGFWIPFPSPCCPSGGQSLTIRVQKG